MRYNEDEFYEDLCILFTIMVASQLGRRSNSLFLIGACSFVTCASHVIFIHIHDSNTVLHFLSTSICRLGNNNGSRGRHLLSRFYGTARSIVPFSMADHRAMLGIEDNDDMNLNPSGNPQE